MADEYFREVINYLKSEGYYQAPGGKGSHQKWMNDDDNRPTVIVPFNLKARHTANGILKDAGIPKKF